DRLCRGRGARCQGYRHGTIWADLRPEGQTALVPLGVNRMAAKGPGRNTSMHDADRFKLLHGPYKAPPSQLGSLLFCEIRGWVTVKRISDGPIPWPQTIVKHSRAIILCGDLVEAVRRESNQAISYWWGVTPQTVTVWRKALDVPRFNEGTF